MKNALLFFSLFLSAAISAANFYALERLWYWQYPWFDIPMHFSGGVLVGTIALWAAMRHGRRLRIAWILALAISVGVAWEIFEYAVGAVAVTERSYFRDTLGDLVLDMLGALAPFVFVRYFYGKQQ